MGYGIVREELMENDGVTEGSEAGNAWEIAETDRSKFMKDRGETTYRVELDEVDEQYTTAFN